MRVALEFFRLFDVYLLFWFSQLRRARVFSSFLLLCFSFLGFIGFGGLVFLRVLEFSWFLAWLLALS